MPNYSPSLAAGFAEAVGRRWSESVPLSEYSSFKIGGPADVFFEAFSEEELVAAVNFARERSLRFFILGGGYNVLFADEGFRGLIIRNTAAYISLNEQGFIRISSGSRLKDLTEFCIRESLGGLEFLAGIPGTVGGAVYGNAGAFGWDIGGSVVSGTLLTPSGEQLIAKQEDFAFVYRWSRLKQTREILLHLILRAAPNERTEIEREVERILQLRKAKHPGPETACAGSYFKNPIDPAGEKIAAALLLDQVGAKQMSVGGAAVYAGHANFIINRDSATSQDIRELAELLKQRVMESSGIQLEEEVIFLPAAG